MVTLRIFTLSIENTMSNNSRTDSRFTPCRHCRNYQTTAAPESVSLFSLTVKCEGNYLTLMPPSNSRTGGGMSRTTSACGTLKPGAVCWTGLYWTAGIAARGGSGYGSGRAQAWRTPTRCNGSFSFTRAVSCTGTYSRIASAPASAPTSWRLMYV